MMPLKSIWHILVVLIALGFYQKALGQSAVRVEATLVLAQANEAPVAPELKDLSRYLDATFPKRFGAYQMAGRSAADIKAGSSQKLDLGKGYITDVLVTEILPEKVKMKVIWRSPDKMLCNTTFTIDRDRPFIIGGPAQGSGTLILMVRSK